MTYAELSTRLGITADAARMLAKRRRWPITSPNKIGQRALVTVPADILATPPNNPPHTFDDVVQSAAIWRDQLHVITELFHSQIVAAEERALRAEQRAEHTERAAQDRINRAEQRAERAERAAEDLTQALIQRTSRRRLWWPWRR